MEYKNSQPTEPRDTELQFRHKSDIDISTTPEEGLRFERELSKFIKSYFHLAEKDSLQRVSIECNTQIAPVVIINTYRIS
jgi:hypothetical protein